MKAKDVCDFLEYKNTKQAVMIHVTNPKWKKTYGELKNDDSRWSILQTPLEVPQNWQESSLFINEPAFNQLLCSSKKPEAKKFFEWLCEEVLPKLRRTGQLTLQECHRSEIATKDVTIEQLTRALVESHKNTQTAIENAKEANNKLHMAFETMAREMGEANKRIYELAVDAIHKPDDPNLLHGMVVIEIAPKKLVCIRRQIRTLGRTVKRLQKNNPTAKKIFHKEKIPNATNAWTVSKQRLREIDPKMKSRANTVYLHSADANDVVTVLNELIEVRNKVGKELKALKF
jgi:prophage antirepressor-like protein